MNHPVSARRKPDLVFAFLMMLIFFLPAGCFGPKEPPRYVDEGEQHLVRLDRTDPPARYDHPAEIDLETLKTALSSVVARHEVSFLNRLLTQKNETRGAAFTSEEVALLADRMKTAFAKGTPEERIAFFLFSRKNSMAAQITSGIAFMEGKELHLILANDQTSLSGEQRSYIPRDNPLHAYEPGSFDLIPQAHQRRVTDASGRKLPGVAIDLTAPAEPVVSSEETAGVPAGASSLEATFRLLKKLREENLITEEEYKEKKAELLKSIEVK